MTDTLRHTVPVPLPRTQESGVAPVHGTGGSATPQTAARPGIPYRTAMQVCPRHPGDSPAARTLQAQSPTDSTENTAAGDTLAADSAADGEFPFLPFGDPFPELPATPWHDVPAAEVFGTASVLVPQQPIYSARAESLTENPVFQGFVLLLAATYAMLLYRNLEDVRLLLTRVSRDRATGERLTEDPGGSGFSRFLNIATTIGMLFMGVMVVKYGDSLMPGRLTELLPHGAVLALSLLATLACAGVVLFQLATVRMAGAVTLSQPFISQVVLLKRTYFTLAVIVTSPVLLLFALCPRGTGGVWFCIIVIELIVTAILYLREVLNLFISKKFRFCIGFCTFASWKSSRSACYGCSWQGDSVIEEQRKT